MSPAFSSSSGVVDRGGVLRLCSRLLASHIDPVIEIMYVSPGFLFGEKTNVFLLNFGTDAIFETNPRWEMRVLARDHPESSKKRGTIA